VRLALARSSVAPDQDRRGGGEHSRLGLAGPGAEGHDDDTTRRRCAPDWCSFWFRRFWALPSTERLV